MKPIVHGLEGEYGQDIEFVYIDIDNPESAAAKAKYGFRVQPHFLLVDANGEVVEQWFGYTEPIVFEDAFGEILSN
jgi:thiol-disulfide isomerase/thioredoxin